MSTCLIKMWKMYWCDWRSVAHMAKRTLLIGRQTRYIIFGPARYIFRPNYIPLAWYIAWEGLFTNPHPGQVTRMPFMTKCPFWGCILSVNKINSLLSCLCFGWTNGPRLTATSPKAAGLLVSVTGHQGVGRLVSPTNGRMLGFGGGEGPTVQNPLCACGGRAFPRAWTLQKQAPLFLPPSTWFPPKGTRPVRPGEASTLCKGRTRGVIDLFKYICSLVQKALVLAI